MNFRSNIPTRNTFSLSTPHECINVKYFLEPNGRKGNAGRRPSYLGHSIVKADPIPLLSLPYPSLIRKADAFTGALKEGDFLSSDGEARV